MRTSRFSRREPDPKPDHSLAADRLVGCAAISEFWFGSDEQKYQRRMFHLLEERKVPCGKLGGSWIASRRALTEYHRRLTDPSADAAE